MIEVVQNDRERAALVGLIAGSDRRPAAEQSMEELAGLREQPAPRLPCACRRSVHGDPATFLGKGKLDVLAGGL
jgi:hypothetical protein